MSGPDIVWARIDNRLVHGQVGNSWVGATGANLVVVADDEVAQDPVQKSIMKMTADSSGCGIRFFTLQKTIDVIHKAASNQHIFIICQNPRAMRVLIEGGVPISEVNVGNMHATGDKRVYHEAHVYVDDADVADFEAMKVAGAKLFIQILPGDKKVYI